MRMTVPFFAGIWRRGPSVVSGVFDRTRAGVSLVRKMSVEYHSGSVGLTWT